MGSKVKALEKEVQDLSRDEPASFRSWFVKYDAAAWDRRIGADVEAGRLDAPAAKAVEAQERGESRDL